MFFTVVKDTGDKRENLEVLIFFIFCLELSWVHFTHKDWSFDYFQFLGVGKLILARLSNRRCPPVNIFLAVLLTLVINFRLFGYFWQVSMTTGKNVITGFNDNTVKFSSGNKLYWRQRSVLSAKLYLAVEVSHSRQYCHWNRHERCIGTSHNLIRGPWGSQNYFKPKRHYLVLVASGASDLDVWGVHGCNFSWRFQWHHWRPCLMSTAGDITDLSPSTFSYPWQFPTSMASLFLSLAINCHWQ